MEGEMGNLKHQTYINGCPSSVVYVPFFWSFHSRLTQKHKRLFAHTQKKNIFKADQDVIKK